VNRSIPISKFTSLVALLTIFSGLISFPRMVKATAAKSPDPANGKLLFEKRCTGCHSLNAEKEGPHLGNVFGRAAGTVPNFKYSDALKSAHVTWDEPSLDKWLTNPDSLIPDNDMAFHVPKAEERADIIRFLRESAGK
jgi:cytochrome c